MTTPEAPPVAADPLKSRLIDTAVRKVVEIGRLVREQQQLRQRVEEIERHLAGLNASVTDMAALVLPEGMPLAQAIRENVEGFRDALDAAQKPTPAPPSPALVPAIDDDIPAQEPIA